VRNWWDMNVDKVEVEDVECEEEDEMDEDEKVWVLKVRFFASVSRIYSDNIVRLEDADFGFVPRKRLLEVHALPVRFLPLPIRFKGREDGSLTRSSSLWFLFCWSMYSTVELMLSNTQSILLYDWYAPLSPGFTRNST
jgi:hypothetical protein